MLLALDTHALLWYLEASPRLSRNALQAVDNPANEVVVPAICIFELEGLHKRGKSLIGGLRAAELIRSQRAGRIVPLRIGLLRDWSSELEMHDAMIVATVRWLSRTGRACTLITADQAIRDSGLVTVIW